MHDKNMKLFVEVDINNFLQAVEDLWIISNPDKMNKLHDNLLIYKEGFRFPVKNREYNMAHYLLESNDKIKTFYTKEKELPYCFSGGFIELVLMYHYWTSLDSQWIFQKEYDIDLRHVEDIETLIKSYIKQDFKESFVNDVFKLIKGCYKFLEDTFYQFGDSLINYDLETEKVKFIESINLYENYLKHFGRKEDGKQHCSD